MNSFPGAGSFALTQLPVNILPSDVLGITATDRGSTPVAATSPQLVNLISEAPSANYVVGDAGVSSPAFTRLKFEVDLSDVYAVFAAIMFFVEGFRDNDNPEWFHRIPASAGLYKTGPQNTSTIANNISLDSVAGLINSDYATNVVAAITDGNIHVGLQVGGQDKTFNHPRVVEGIAIVGTGLGQLRGWQLFTSQNGRLWEPATKSAFSSNGWSSGEKFYALGSFRNVGSSECRVLLFDTPVVANFVKAVYLPTPGSSWNLREVLALNRCGDLVATADFNHATTALPDTDTIDMNITRFNPPAVESVPGRAVLAAVSSSTDTLNAARARTQGLSNQDLNLLRGIVGKETSLSTAELDVLARALGHDPTSNDVALVRGLGPLLGITPPTQMDLGYGSTRNNNRFSNLVNLPSSTPSVMRGVRDGYPDFATSVANPAVSAVPLSPEEAKAIGRSHVSARAIQFDLWPWTPRAARDAEFTVGHLEVFNRADEVGFGANGQLLVMRLSGSLPGVAPTSDDVRILKILNASNETAKSVKAKIPLTYHTVTQTFAAALTTTLTLADAGRRVTNIKVVLNAAKTGVGAFGDQSFTKTSGAALATQVSDTPDATGEFHINHEAGTITIFTATNGSESVTFSYADEGSWATEISADGSTFVQSPTEVTLTGDVPPGQTRDLYVRGNQTLFSDNRERSAVLLASMVFAGSASDIEAV